MPIINSLKKTFNTSAPPSVRSFSPEFSFLEARKGTSMIAKIGGCVNNNERARFRAARSSFGSVTMINIIFTLTHPCNLSKHFLSHAWGETPDSPELSMFIAKIVTWLNLHPAQEAKSQRCILSASQASEIYKLRFLASTSASDPNSTGHEISYSILLAAQYGVSSKTIRDIWNRKTWINATRQLFDQEQACPIGIDNHEYFDRQV